MPKRPDPDKARLSSQRFRRFHQAGLSVFFVRARPITFGEGVLPVRVQKIFNQGQELRRMELWGLRAATVLD
jgi:hypothetical protein